ncbi:hypothetical protein Pelo_1397 [Pelomyxa schiedti]|nr:hypothetical protein Pelo_1397 [Pelomyxa schiedti]
MSWWKGTLGAAFGGIKKAIDSEQQAIAAEEESIRASNVWDPDQLSRAAKTVKLPWNELDSVPEQFRNVARGDIIKLATDQHALLNAPPSVPGFEFDYNSIVPVAFACLGADALLSKTRTSLVPKQISEENFWHNYFLRIHLIKASYQKASKATSTSTTKIESLLPEPPATSPAMFPAPPSTLPATLPQTATAPTEETSTTEFVSDSLDGHQNNNVLWASSNTWDEIKVALEELNLPAATPQTPPSNTTTPTTTTEASPDKNSTAETPQITPAETATTVSVSTDTTPSTNKSDNTEAANATTPVEEDWEKAIELELSTAQDS